MTAKENIQHNNPIETSSKLRQLLPYLVSVIAFVIYKMLYPQPDIFLDSKNYIDWALEGHPVSYRPIGYSYYLHFFIGSSNNYITLVYIQYFVSLLSFYFFCETIFRLFNFNNGLRIATFCLTIFNPFSFFLVNLISPDSFFLSLTAVWLTTLLLIFSGHKRFYLLLAIHLATFALLFELRYNALYYPFITVLSLVIYKWNIRHLTLVGTSLVLVVMLYQEVVKRTEAFTGVAVFSGFGGWIMANNAIHVYDMAEVDRDIFDTPEEFELHDMTVKYKDSIVQYNRGREVTDEYMWDDNGPLKHYIWEKVDTHVYPKYFIGWYNVASIYGGFGKKLILHYPFAFLRMFYLPNLLSYFYPPLETMETFDVYNTELGTKTQGYLGIKSAHLDKDNTGLQHNIMITEKRLYLLIDILAIATLIMLIVRRIQGHTIHEGIKLLALFYVVVLGMSAFGHPILIRYISVLLILGNVLPIAYLGWEMQRRKQASTQS